MVDGAPNRRLTSTSCRWAAPRARWRACGRRFFSLKTVDRLIPISYVSPIGWAPTDASTPSSADYRAYARLGHLSRLLPQTLEDEQLLSRGRGNAIFGRTPASRSVSVTTIAVEPDIDPEAMPSVARERLQVAIAGGPVRLRAALSASAIRANERGDYSRLPRRRRGGHGGARQCLRPRRRERTIVSLASESMFYLWTWTTPVMNGCTVQ
jgi:hypothetical protein